VLLAAAVVAPTVTASAFAAERERGTMDLLLLQGPSAGRVVFGKVLAGFIFCLFVLGVSIPLFPAAWSFGGVTGDQVLTMASVVFVSTFLFCALGVFFGALTRSALQAAYLAQAVAFFLIFGTLGLHLAASAFGAGDLFRPLLWLNPYVALLSSASAATDAVARAAPSFRLLGTLAQVTWIPGLALPAWILACALWSMLAAALVLVTGVVVDPCHPLKTRRRA
jgi:ABC-type transport system involved in multi-copper enzyme maturation permease subunit